LLYPAKSYPSHLKPSQAEIVSLIILVVMLTLVGASGAFPVEQSSFIASNSHAGNIASWEVMCCLS
jgi:hypothetical protein